MRLLCDFHYAFFFPYPATGNVHVQVGSMSFGTPLLVISDQFPTFVITEVFAEARWADRNIDHFEYCLDSGVLSGEGWLGICSGGHLRDVMPIQAHQVFAY